MKTALTVAMLVCSTTLAWAQERLADQLRKGIVQEEANQNLEKAIAAYHAIVAQYDQDRQAAATALFRLAECYRKTGKREQAVAAYQRVVREFADQAALVEPSRQQLATTYGLSEPRPARSTAPTAPASERDVRAAGRSAAAPNASVEATVAFNREVRLKQIALKDAERQLAAVQDKINAYQIQIKNGFGSTDSIEFRQLQRDLAAAYDRLELARTDLQAASYRAAAPSPRDVTPESLQATQLEMDAMQKRLADMKRRVDAGVVHPSEYQELQTQFEMLALRYQQQLKQREASEAEARDARALNERLIKNVEAEITLIQQRIALLEKQVEVGTASSGNAELLQLRRDLLSLQRRLDELKVGLRR